MIYFLYAWIRMAGSMYASSVGLADLDLRFVVSKCTYAASIRILVDSDTHKAELYGWSDRLGICYGPSNLFGMMCTVAFKHIKC